MTMKYTVTVDGDIKKIESDCYNYVYNFSAHTLLRWGATKEENPTYAPFGPEVIIVENSISAEALSLVLSLANANNTVFGIITDKPTKVIEELCKEAHLDLIIRERLREAYLLELGMFNLYVDENGNFYPSRLCVNNSLLEPHTFVVPIMEVNNFIKDVWYNDLFIKFRWHIMDLQARQKGELEDGSGILFN